MKAVIISISNSGTEIKRVAAFDPDYKEKGILIESGLSTLTYKEILRGLYPAIDISLIYVTAFKITGKEGYDPNYSMQHMDLKIESRSIDGLALLESVALSVDPYQQQKGMVVVKKHMDVDHLTYFHFNAYPGMKYFIHLYLADVAKTEPIDHIKQAPGQFGEKDMKDNINTYVDPTIAQPASTESK